VARGFACGVVDLRVSIRKRAIAKEKRMREEERAVRGGSLGRRAEFRTLTGEKTKSGRAVALLSLIFVFSLGVLVFD
jgi:hypothetical protein